MTTYSNCQIAIKNHINQPTLSNVSKDKNLVSCSHTKSSCHWIGNGIHYTCLTDTKETPQNVYDTLSGGNQSIIIYDDD